MVPQSSQLPLLPGVYFFKKEDVILYVGKAKSLRKRVASYFNKQANDWKVAALIQEATHVEHILTRSEHEALLLEAQLIRDNKPKYNVLLKNGQPFIYIFKTHTDLPRLELVRNKKKKGSYFGPFLCKKQARAVYQYLLNTFQLNLCTHTIQTGCLRYHLQKCAGNCKPDFDAEAYLFRLELALNLLEGQYKKSLAALNAQIKKHSEALEFEKARNLHTHAQHIETVFDALKTGFTEKRYATDIFLATTPVSRKVEQADKAMQQLQEILELPHKPTTIDCFDISHFQGNYMVGSCIRFTGGAPDKNKFRRFKIRTLEQQNDYAALQEIVMRRYRDPANLPDVILIDGGKGQRSAITQLLPNALIISLAKKEERLHTPQHPEGIILDMHTPLGTLLTALRDYAHHFAISYHRTRRHTTSEK
jgi:excinuclease ABC subunit C